MYINSHQRNINGKTEIYREKYKYIEKYKQRKNKWEDVGKLLLSYPSDENEKETATQEIIC